MFKNRFIYFVIDKEYDVEFIKSFVEFNKRFNSDDGFYLLNEGFDLYSPSYSNVFIMKYPYKKHKISFLLKDVIKAIKDSKEDAEKYLIIITDLDDIEDRFKNQINNIKYIISKEITEDVVKLIFESDL